MTAALRKLLSWWQPMWTIGFAAGCAWELGRSTGNSTVIFFGSAVVLSGLPLWAAGRVEKWLRPEPDLIDDAG